MVFNNIKNRKYLVLSEVFSEGAHGNLWMLWRKQHGSLLLGHVYTMKPAWQNVSIIEIMCWRGSRELPVIHVAMAT